jgi:hypothetical protein
VDWLTQPSIIGFFAASDTAVFAAAGSYTGSYTGSYICRARLVMIPARPGRGQLIFSDTAN